MIPQYVMFTKMQWTNSLLPLIIPGLFGNVGVIFFLRQNLTSIPSTLVEAAKIDGCGYLPHLLSDFPAADEGRLDDPADPLVHGHLERLSGAHHLHPG